MVVWLFIAYVYGLLQDARRVLKWKPRRSSEKQPSEPFGRVEQQRALAAEIEDE